MGGTASCEVAEEAPYYREGCEHRVQYDEGVHWKSRKEDVMQFRCAQKGMASLSDVNYTTIPALFETAAKLKEKKMALRVERGPGNTMPKSGKDRNVTWSTWSWREYYDQSCTTSRAFIALGLPPHCGVAIFGFNAPEWHMAFMATLCAGGLSVGIYPTDNRDQVGFKAAHSSTVIAVVQGDKEAQIFGSLAKEGKLPKLKAIVYWGDCLLTTFQTPEGGHVEVVPWRALPDWAKKSTDAEFISRRKSLNPGGACSLVYTSGTTGNPKAVMLSHDNFHYESWCLKDLIGGHNLLGEQRIVSYLPLSHVAGMLVDIIAPVVLSARGQGWVSITFARQHDLKEATLKHRLVATRPTLFLGVPRVWEKMEQTMKEMRQKNPPGPCKAWMIDSAKESGLAFAKEKQMGGTGISPGCHTSCLKTRVYSAVKKALGLDRLVMAFSGAAPIQTETLQFFAQFGIDITEIYGMSECTGATTSNGHTARVWGSCGYALAGMEVAILQPDTSSPSNYIRAQPCPPEDLLSPALPEKYQGEVCFRGRHIMMGYLANPELGEDHVKEIEDKNMEAIDKNGWLHSGDKGVMDSRGMFKITGRYKELIVTAGGENVAPVPIEGHLKDLLGGAVNNVMMIGDKKKFNIVLVTLCTKGATGEKPGSNELFGAAASVSSSNTVAEAQEDPVWISKIEAAIMKTNKDGSVVPSNASKVQKFSILPQDFSVMTGELTPTLKIKRSVVEEKYKELIDAFYNDDNVSKNYVRCQVAINAPFPPH